MEETTKQELAPTPHYIEGFASTNDPHNEKSGPAAIVITVVSLAALMALAGAIITGVLALATAMSYSSPYSSVMPPSTNSPYDDYYGQQNPFDQHNQGLPGSNSGQDYEYWTPIH